MATGHCSRASARKRYRTIGGGVIVAGLVGLSQAALGDASSQDASANIIAAHIANQGFRCEPPRWAQRDKQGSKPLGASWFLHCSNTTYRVMLIPDKAARVVSYPLP